MALDARHLLLKTQAYIDGSWVASSHGKTFDVFNPANGDLVAKVEDCGTDEAVSAVEAAQRAWLKWHRTTSSERSVVLHNWHNLIIDNADELAAILTREMGKPLTEARGEILYGASYLEWYAEEAKRIYGETFPSGSTDSRALVLRQSVGVCVFITPWNFPNAMLMRKTAAALAAGCTVVSKPAEETPLSALAMAALAEIAGVPKGVFNVVPTSRPAEVGEVFTSHPLVRKLSFTGSTEVGRILLSQSAKGIKKVSMELGGNAPFIVFEDADVDAAIEGAIASKFRNAGQTCVCSNRFLIHSKIKERFTEKLSARMKAMKLGSGEDPDSEIGPLINTAALSKVERLVNASVASGALLITGGRKSNVGDLFFEPTLLSGVTQKMAIFREEIFGPVVPIIEFETEAEAIAMANDTDFGLAAYFYTRDIGRIWRVGEALEYGMVGANTGAISSASAPFGGIKQSGMGREGSRHGLDDYLELKYLLMGGLGA